LAGLEHGEALHLHLLTLRLLCLERGLLLGYFLPNVYRLIVSVDTQIDCHNVFSPTLLL
jgi:hypothetical protein